MPEPREIISRLVRVAIRLGELDQQPAHSRQPLRRRGAEKRGRSDLTLSPAYLDAQMPGQSPP
jgi:hypothetical protein